MVRQLDAPRLEQRDDAEAALLAHGPAILDLLPPPEAADSAEVRQRLDRVRQRLQQLAANAAADASIISLRAESMPLSQVLVALQRQSGNAIVDYRPRFGQPAADPALTIDLARTPFWSALDRVLDMADLTVYPFAERRAIGVISRVDGQRNRRFGRASYDGPFRFEATDIVARRNLTDAGRTLVDPLPIEAAWEPRLRPIILVQRMADVAATDETGRPLAGRRSAGPSSRLHRTVRPA